MWCPDVPTLSEPARSARSRCRARVRMRTGGNRSDGRYRYFEGGLDNDPLIRRWRKSLPLKLKRKKALGMTVANLRPSKRLTSKRGKNQWRSQQDSNLQPTE